MRELCQSFSSRHSLSGIGTSQRLPFPSLSVGRRIEWLFHGYLKPESAEIRTWGWAFGPIYFLELKIETAHADRTKRLWCKYV
jgi:hypothetical protein